MTAPDPLVVVLVASLAAAIAGYLTLEWAERR